MNDKGVSEEARKHIKDLITETWKELNAERLASCRLFTC